VRREVCVLGGQGELAAGGDQAWRQGLVDAADAAVGDLVEVAVDMGNAHQ
jgi:hypothetical protein